MFGAEFEPVDVVVARDGGAAVRIHGGNAESPLEVWRTVAAEPGLVTGGPVPGAGHFLAEENHADTLAALQAFLRT